MTGQLINEQNLTHETQFIDLSKLHSGWYFFRINELNQSPQKGKLLIY